MHNKKVEGGFRLHPSLSPLPSQRPEEGGVGGWGGGRAKSPKPQDHPLPDWDWAGKGRSAQASPEVAPHRRAIRRLFGFVKKTEAQ